MLKKCFAPWGVGSVWVWGVADRRRLYLDRIIKMHI